MSPSPPASQTASQQPLAVPLSASARAGVDPAALSLGGVAAAVALVTGQGAWTLTSTLIGVALLCIVVGYHQIEPRTPRGISLTVGYSLVVGLLLVLIASYFIQGILNGALGGAPSWLYDISGTPRPDCTYTRDAATCQFWIESATAAAALNASLWLLVIAVPSLVLFELRRSRTAPLEPSAPEVAQPPVAPLLDERNQAIATDRSSPAGSASSMEE